MPSREQSHYAILRPAMAAAGVIFLVFLVKGIMHFDRVKCRVDRLQDRYDIRIGIADAAYQKDVMVYVIDLQFVKKNSQRAERSHFQRVRFRNSRVASRPPGA